MGFVDKNEVNRRPLASRERLYRAHLDRLVAIGALVDPLHDADAVNAFGFERGDGLVNQAHGRNGKGDALSLVERALDDVRGRQGLAEARGRLKHRATLTGRQRAPEGL
jgi:hypothetical protein